ncbi:MAG: hypothetical protein ACYTEL_17200 [Planctomycetota bacterium]
MASRNGKRIAFEIETGKSDTVANVSKCLRAGFKEIAVVATPAKVRDRLRETLPRQDGVTLLTACELLR